MKKKWNVKIDGRILNNEEIIETLLEHRGIDNIDEFLYPNDDFILPLEDLKNIEKAALTILKGVEAGKTFYVHFDTDQDGCCSGSIATRYLLNLGADVYTGINHGKKHGISELDPYCIGGADIVWIVDSIETSIEPYEEMLNMGIQIIITDHHLINLDLVKQMEDRGIILVSSAVNYDNPDLSGSATTWKLCKMIDELNIDDYADKLVDLAGAGLIADMCSVSSMENRAICHKAFNNLHNPGIKKINGSYAFVARNISFGIAPKINAANRTDNNELAMNIFLSDDENEINDIVKALNKCRENQNEIVNEIMPDLIKQGNKQIGTKCMFFIMPHVDASIGGLIGNKLLEIFQVPLLVMSKYGDEYTGSARAIGVKSFKAYFDSVGIGWSGGHENAFGYGIPVNQFENFKTKILEELADIEFICETFADIQLDVCQVTDKLIRNLNALNRISGTGFEPITVMIETDDYEISSMSNGKHLKIVDNKTGIIFVKWNYNGSWNFDGTFKAIGTLEKVHYGKNNYSQLTIQDFKLDK